MRLVKEISISAKGIHTCDGPSVPLPPFSSQASSACRLEEAGSRWVWMRSPDRPRYGTCVGMYFHMRSFISMRRHQQSGSAQTDCFVVAHQPGGALVVPWDGRRQVERRDWGWALQLRCSVLTQPGYQETVYIHPSSGGMERPVASHEHSQKIVVLSTGCKS